MSAETQPEDAESPGAAFVVPAHSAKRRLFTRLFRFAIGVLLTATPVTAVVVAGWVQRRMQRAAYLQWWRIAGQAGNEAAFLQALAEIDPALAVPESPRWLGHEQPRRHYTTRSAGGLRGRIAGALGAMTASLWENFRGGLALLLHTFAVTLPATLLWAFSWRYGWDNSFNFGYEQSVIGPSLGVTGVVLFIAAMIYVPMAQAHMAAARSWRAFYDVRLVARVIRRKWGALLVLTALYFLFSLPILALKILIAYLDAPEGSALTNAEFASLQDTRYLAMGIVGLFGYLVLHGYAARIFASGLAAALREGTVLPEELAPTVRRVFAGFGLLQSANHIAEHPARRFVRQSSERSAYVAAMAVTLLIWFGVVAQIYVGQFMVYVPLRGWVNQPMIHAPWFNYTPRYLHQSEGEPALPDAVFKK